VKKEGPGALLSGLGPTIVGYGIEGAMKVRDRELACFVMYYLPSTVV
jgi:hypothetical protein